MQLNILIKGYQVQLPTSPVTQEFFPVQNNNLLEARDQAIKLALDFKKEYDKFMGIKIYIEYHDGLKLRKQNILTGRRMHTKDILKALQKEAAIVEIAGFQVPAMNTNFEKDEYFAINQNYISLYYFTA